ncbi:MAG: T9SS type A sorting domain-containing protein [Bacteroidales bacterium]|jgi:hypothetical protein
MKKALLILFAAAALLAAGGQTYASVIYTPMNITASQTSTWNWFAFDVDANGFGLWVNVGASLRLETYSGPVIGTDDAGMVFLNSIAYGTEIGAASTWVTPATPAYINDATHTDLNGKTVYVAVQLLDAAGVTFYGWMQFVVASDGLSVTLAGMAYQDAPGESLLAGVIDRQLSYGKTECMEDLRTNDGSIGTTLPLSLIGADFSMATGTMVPDTHFRAVNVPAGLTALITVTDSKTAVLSFTGKATAHAQSDTREDLMLEFLDAAFTGAAASEVIDSGKGDLVIKFFDPYQIVYEDLTDLVCTSGGWAPFENNHFGVTFGLWHDATDMRIETYGTSVIGTMNLGKSLITPLDAGARIDSMSAWVTTGAWPNEPYINTSTYTSWNGKHKYAGIQLIIGDAVLYGWLNLESSDDGKTLTLYDWAFNTQPKGAIIAGQMTSSVPFTSLETNSFSVSPNPFGNEIVILLSQPLKDQADLQILDLTGKVVYQEKLNSIGTTSQRIQAGHLIRGVYFLRLQSQGMVSIQKIIRE